MVSNKRSSRRSRRRSRRSSKRRKVTSVTQNHTPQVFIKRKTDHPAMPETFIYTYTIYKTTD